jgi:hypothetical protein
LEKLLYVLWKKPESSVGDFGGEIRGPAASKLLSLGVDSLSVNLADEDSAFAHSLRISRMEEPLSGTLSVWLDRTQEREPVEAIIAEATARFASYLVLESVPLRNRTHLAPLGERLPGFTTVAFLEKPDWLTHEAWLEQWQEHHTQIAIETQSTYLYIQNVVVRALTPDAPPWAAIVEEGFPAEAATDPMVFYAADGSREKLRENQRRMIESCRKFIDFDRLETHPMSTYILL